jgi:hypothetical protein
MISLTSLWLPILASSAAVFVASSIVWMALPHHKTDWRKLQDDDAFLDAVRRQGLTGGMYMFPACRPEDLKDPEAQARFKKGPWGSVTLLSAAPNMGRALSLWFVHLGVVSVFVAYVMGHALGAGEPFSHVFRLSSAMAWIAYAGGALPGAIWEGKPWSFAWKAVADGLAYALVSGAVFASLWPEAAPS